MFYVFYKYGKDLPSINELKSYDPEIASRVYASNGILLKEYATEHRLFVPINNIPEIVKNAFLAAEDNNFYNHIGIDLVAILKAMVSNIKALKSGNSVRGASTITQQVVKNMLLTNERTITRKIKEAILSLRITKALPKDKILELYLNQIFLGYRSYGVASASLNYFNKSLDELTIEEAALLAALPKAPSNLNPKTNYSNALARRNWVIERMYIEKYISEEEMNNAIKKNIVLSTKNNEEYQHTGSFIEDVRKNFVNLYGKEKLLKGGMLITTTVDPNIQKIMQENFKDGIENYDRRHGYRRSLGNIYEDNNFYENWPEKLKNFQINSYFRNNWRRAVVLGFDSKNNKIEIGLTKNKNEEEKKYNKYFKKNGETYIKSYLSFKYNSWAVLPEIANNNNIKEKAKNIHDLNLFIGDVIFVKETVTDGYLLRQTPEVNGGAIMMDVHTGRILGMVGGYIDSETTFNRATQANRQLGSIMKPFVYLSAFESGLNPASTIMDEPITLDQGYGLPPYTPTNYDETKFYGFITLRTALQLSLNVASVRLASEIGLDRVAKIIQRFGINENPPKIYSLVLGSIESKLVNITQAYATLVNGGKKIYPSVIEKIQDKYGQTVFKRDNRVCEYCTTTEENIDNVIIPNLTDNRESITNKANAYQMVSILEGIVNEGMAWRAKAIGKTIAGKTGTSNDWRDAWFIGFSPDIVLGVYVGYDDNRSLGKDETGSKAALPIFTNIMKNVLKDKANIPFRIPNNIELIKIDKTTGKRPTLISKQKDMIFETFVKGTAPENENEELKELIEQNNNKNIDENPTENKYNNVMELIEGVF